MITFEDPALSAALTRRKLYGKIRIAYITALALGAICLAAFSGYAENSWNLYVVLLCVYSLALLSFILFCVFVIAKADAQLKLLVCETVAAAFYDRENFLNGADVRLSVSYSGDILTVSRENYAGEIIGGKSVAEGGGEIQFDLSALKTVPSVYSSVGEKLLLFLQSYYFKNAKKLNAANVTVTDNTSGKPFTVACVANGEPVAADNEYYFKRGLIND